MEKPSKTTDQAVLALLGNPATLPTPAPKTITYAYRSTKPGAAQDDSAYGNLSSSFERLTNKQITYMEEAFNAWEDVAKVTFSRQFGANNSAYSDSGTVLIQNYTVAKTASGGFANGSIIGLNNDQDASKAIGDVQDPKGFNDVTNPTFGSRVFEVLYVHEIGHIVGLSHPSKYNSTDKEALSYATKADYREDARPYSVMSYWDPADVGATWLVASTTPMIHDIAAAQQLYGANMSTRAGDTVYGFYSNADREGFRLYSSGTSEPPADKTFAIWDGGGNDTINMSQYSTSQTIDLTPESYSSTGNQKLNIAIARGVIIENAIGGFGNDILGGNGVANFLSAGAGNDTAYGHGGADTIYGAFGNDTIFGGADNDTLYGDLTGLPVAYDGDGNDYIDGEGGYDKIFGGSGADRLFGGAEMDTLEGGLGDDEINGGTGIDTVNYANAKGSVQVALVDGGGNGFGKISTAGGLEVDTLVSIEDIEGSAFADNLTGNGVNNSILGGGGNDRIEGAGGNDVLSGNIGDDTLSGGTGNDMMYGDQGVDTATYAGETAAVTIDMLGAPTAGKVTTAGGTDTLVDIENAIGSNFADTIIGNQSNNRLSGAAGNDTIRGNGGDDVLDGGVGTNTLDGGVGSDTASYESATTGVQAFLSAGWGKVFEAAGQRTDTFVSIENLIGSAFDDSLSGDANVNSIAGGAGNDSIDGGAGSDALDGGAGIDTVNYGAETAGVSMLTGDIASGKITTASGGDTVTNFENAYGSAFADTLTGSAANNVIAGRGGADRLEGGGGIDTVDYSEKTAAIYLNGLVGIQSVIVGGVAEDTISGFENVIGGEGSDYLVGADGANALSGGGGADTFRGLGGADILDGGTGVDIALYGEKLLAISVTLNGAADAVVTVGGIAEDRIRNIENIIGGRGGDRITGDALANILSGYDGDDILRGGGGADKLYGDAGNDTADYGDKTAAVSVTLNGNAEVAVTVGGVTEDTIASFESVIGGSGADRLTGDASANRLSGGSGDDWLAGRGGIDRLDGGAGLDTADYADATASVAVTLAGGTAATVRIGGVASDTLTFIENVVGGKGADNLTGDGLANRFMGGAGKDVIDGKGGVDTANYSDKSAAVTVALNGAAAATVSVAGVAEDTLRNIENVTGGSGADRMVGDALANILNGGGGADRLNGLGGSDMLTGGSGADRFIFSSTLGSGNVDRITDFGVDDLIELSRSVFGALKVGTLAAEAFKNLSIASLDASDRILYNRDTGHMAYDVDGSGSADSVRFATLDTRPNLHFDDFILV